MISLLGSIILFPLGHLLVKEQVRSQYGMESDASMPWTKANIHPEQQENKSKPSLSLLIHTLLLGQVMTLKYVRNQIPGICKCSLTDVITNLEMGWWSWIRESSVLTIISDMTITVLGGRWQNPSQGKEQKDNRATVKVTYSRDRGQGREIRSTGGFKNLGKPGNRLASRRPQGLQKEWWPAHTWTLELWPPELWE